MSSLKPEQKAALSDTARCIAMEWIENTHPDDWPDMLDYEFQWPEDYSKIAEVCREFDLWDESSCTPYTRYEVAVWSAVADGWDAEVYSALNRRQS